MSISQATLHTSRPMCSKDRAHAYDATRRRNSTTASPPKPISSTPPISLASSLSDDADTRLTGDLVDFQEELRTFEERFYEPPVGTFMDASAATTGYLYDLRDCIRDGQ